MTTYSIPFYRLKYQEGVEDPIALDLVSLKIITTDGFRFRMGKEVSKNDSEFGTISSAELERTGGAAYAIMDGDNAVQFGPNGVTYSANYKLSSKYDMDVFAIEPGTTTAGFSYEYFNIVGGTPPPIVAGSSISLSDYLAVDSYIVKGEAGLSAIKSGPFAASNYLSGESFSLLRLPGASSNEDDVLDLGKANTPDKRNIYLGDGNDVLIGSDKNHDIYGGAGNDRISTGNGLPGENYLSEWVDAGTGEDTVNLSGRDKDSSIVYLAHQIDGASLTINVDGAANTGSVVKGSHGTTTYTDIASGLTGGIEFRGWTSSDTISIKLAKDQYIRMNPDAGNDTVSRIGSEGIFALEYDSKRQTTGVQADLSKGLVSNDGFGGTDRITGFVDDFESSDNADDVTGATYSQYLFANEGNDTISGNGGADLLDGGDGDDVLYGDDRSVQVSDAGNQVFRLYQATLGRGPDAPGLEGWAQALIDGDKTLLSIIDGFTKSAEFKSLYGDSPSNEQFVELLYQNVLGRAPDAAGQKGWLDLMDNGLSQAKVVQGFSESQEFKVKTADEASAFVRSTSDTAWGDAVFRLYQATLGRTPDATGLNGWVKELSVGGRNYLDVVEGFVNSTEFQTRFKAETDEEFVTLLYQNVLGRAPDESGIAGWVELLQQGTNRADVVRGFAESAENIRDSQSKIETFMKSLKFDDLLIGGKGNDELIGGFGRDVFNFRKDGDGTNTIRDFEAWDLIRIQSDQADQDVAAFVTTNGSQVGADAVLMLGDEYKIVVANTQLDELTSDTLEFYK